MSGPEQAKRPEEAAKPAPQVFAMPFAKKAQQPSNTGMDPSWSTGASGSGDQDD